MRITTKSKYGMRMIVEIAAQPEGKAASLKAIARKINASEKYLEQIVIPLTKAGYLKSLRGANGGYVMGRSAEELTAHMVIAALEGEASQRACVGEIGGCPRADTCSVIGLWQKINQAIASVTDTVTIADLVRERREKYAALGLEDSLDRVRDENPPATSNTSEELSGLIPGSFLFSGKPLTDDCVPTVDSGTITSERRQLPQKE